MTISKTTKVVFILAVVVFACFIFVVTFFLTVNRMMAQPPGEFKVAGLDNQETGLSPIIEEIAEVVEVRTDLLYPDLSIKPPAELYIAGTANSKQLRFSTTFVNLGPGPLEVLGHADLGNNLTHAAQYIYALGAPGEYKNIGSFELHPTHSHWHVNDHVRYSLWTIDDQNQKLEQVADTGKMSFCLWDEHTNDLSIPNSPQSRVYGFTCDSIRQGMSVGWGDTYQAKVEGQELDITNLPNGEYLLEYNVNPDKKIYEATYSNNIGQTKIRIDGFAVTRL